MGRGTRTPGIRAAAVVAVCGLLAVAPIACGTGPARYTRADARAEQARLRGLLPLQEDMPEGFSARPRDGWRPPFRAENPECRTVLNMAGGGSPRRTAEPRVTVTYQGDDVGELAGVALVSYTGAGAALRFAEISDALDGCPVAAGPLAGRGTSLRVSPLEVDVPGDVRAGRLRGRLNGYPYELHVVFARVGNTVASLVHSGMAGIDEESTRRLARLVVGRLSA
ncbi:hypothetical protein [Streptosporangium sandarakinum]